MLYNQPSPNSPHILLVDDLRENIFALKKSLENLRVNIDVAQSGNQALQKMIEKRYAVVILDVQMPDMNGFEVAKVMQENEDTKYTPIIFVTAISKEDEHVFQGYNVGAVDYIFKPVNPNVLRCKVKVFVDLYLIGQQLLKSKLDIENTLNSVMDAVITVDQNCIIQHCNTAAISMAQGETEKIQGKSVFDIFSFIGETSHQDCKKMIQEASQSQQGYKLAEKVNIINKYNKKYLVELSTVPLLNIDSQCMGLVFTMHDVTEPQLLHEKLHHQATHDALTNLPNRFDILEKLKALLSNSTKKETKLAVIFIDLDGFKSVNESLGHRYGDEVLKSTAERLIENIEKTDLCARVGADEFVVILNDADEEKASKIASNLLEAIGQPYNALDKVVYIEASIGITLYPKDSTDADLLIQNADSAMYAAKEAGRNCFRFFERPMQQKMKDILKMKHELRAAIQKNQFVLYFQPQRILEENNDNNIGFETLIRWQHPVKGLISPNDFIPIAEDSGLIQAIDNWVLFEACRAVSKFKVLTKKALHVAVNISSVEFNDKKFIDNLMFCLKEFDVNPDQIEIEVTERMFINDTVHVIEKIKLLKDIGVTVAIDDFGTGYSNLVYLKYIPVDVLKIDRAFIKNLTISEKDRAITRVIIELGKHLGMKVVAEGVETKAQYNWLKENGCYAIQGFLYSKPMNWEQTTQFLKAGIEPQ